MYYKTAPDSPTTSIKSGSRALGKAAPRCLQSPAATRTPISKHFTNLLPNKIVFHVTTASLINNDAEINKVLVKAVFYTVFVIFNKKDINHSKNKILLESAPKNKCVRSS